MAGDSARYVSMFADNWGFFLGDGRDYTRVDIPGRWEDLLFAFSRNDITGTVREEMSYSLQFRGNGREMLKKQITGPRGLGSLELEVRKWDPKDAKWGVYYHGVIDDESITIHDDYAEATCKPVGVAEDLIAKADHEYTVEVAGTRIEIPRVTLAEPLAVTQKKGQPYQGTGWENTCGVVNMRVDPETRPNSPFSATISLDTAGATPLMVYTQGGQKDIAQPYLIPSSLDGVMLVAKAGRYIITNNVNIAVEAWFRGESVSGVGETWQNVACIFTSGLSSGGAPKYDLEVPATQRFIIAGSVKIAYGRSVEVVLAKGDTIKVSALTDKGDNLRVGGTVSLFSIKYSEYRLVQVLSGSFTITPAMDADSVTPITAPAVKDTDLFAALVRKATEGASVLFDFSKYLPAYRQNPDGTPAVALLLSLSHMKESLVENGVAAPQGSNTAYFKGITLNQFYKYFLAQGYKVAVETRDGKPTVFVAPYCNTEVVSYFFPRYTSRTPVLTDLGTLVIDVELSRYEHTFLQVVAGQDPENFGTYPKEEGYQDPCNRRITYGLGIENSGEPYEISIPFPLTTLGLEEVLQTFENESDEARAQRWTEGDGIWLVSASEVPSLHVVQYDAVPGIFYKPLNLGFRPESLVRRNIPLLAMSLKPFTDTINYEVESIEGDDINVTSDEEATGDVSYVLAGAFSTDSPVDTEGEDGILLPVMITFRSATRQNIYEKIADNSIRYGVVKFRYRGKEVVGYLRSCELNPTELAVQKWEILPVWGQNLDL